MSLCTYTDTYVHPDRFGGRRPLPPIWAVVHTTEGSEGPSSAEALASMLGRPGDRQSSDGSRYGSSYHRIMDTFPNVIRAVPDELVSFSAPGSNTEGIHLVIPGRAGQTREEWLDDVSLSAIRTTAAQLIDLNAQYGIPLRRQGETGLIAKIAGYTDHGTVSRAFKRSTHWDVGPSFPWDVLAGEIAGLLAPPPPQPESEYDMAGIAALYIPSQTVRASMPPDTAATFVLCASGDIRHASMSDVQHARALRVPEYLIPDMAQYAHCAAAARKGMPAS